MAASVPAGPGRIFISYRRKDAAYATGWLFDQLADRFGRDQVFKDVDSIRPGDDFAGAAGSCDVLLAVIGSRWLACADEDGRWRLIEAALARDGARAHGPRGFIAPEMIMSPDRGDCRPADVYSLRWLI